MDFTVNDMVVHPKHGVGRISGVKDVEFVEGFERYYAIELPEDALTLHIPVGKMEELGLRRVMKESRVDRVLETLCAVPKKLADNYKSRQAKIRKKLDSGQPLQIARAVRDLTWRGQSKSLTRVDARLLDRGRDLLAAELAAVKEVAAEEAMTLIDMTLQRGFKQAEAAA